MSKVMVPLELPADSQLPASVLNDLNDRLIRIAKQLSNNAQSISDVGAVATPDVTVGARAARLATPAANYAEGSEWVEYDTALTYIARGISLGNKGLVWWYLSGNQRGTYANRPTILGKFDAGLLYTVTDKNRTLYWSGTAWTFAAWESIPIGFITGFPADPGAGWHICDGSAAVIQLNADGTTSSITVQDFTTAKYPKWGSTAAGAGAAVAPLITGSTGPGTNHHHGLGSVTAAATAATAITVTSSGAVQVAAQAHTHALTGTMDDESSHTHPHGTLANDVLGEPPHYGLIAYQRI